MLELETLYLKTAKMFKLKHPLCSLQRLLKVNHQKLFFRNFLSEAYYCNEVWDQRLSSPILQKIKLDELYQDLDQRYQKQNQISSIDVDLFANSLTDDSYHDELLDLTHKLRMSAESSNMLNSTAHAVVRYLVKHERHEDLLNVLDDRLNYGVFLDYYTANLLLDKYWKSTDYVNGARVASQFMLQEECNHPLSSSLSLLHCYKFLQNPVGWPEATKPEEPEEEVKIRVKFLRNPYDDDHFDLRDPLKIVGKTIMFLTRNSENIMDKSFHIVGLMLYGKDENAKELLKGIKEPLCKEIIDLLPEEKKLDTHTQSIDVENDLKERVKKAEREIAERDVKEQCEKFNTWELERKEALDKQIGELKKIRRLENVEQIQKELQVKEQKLWFFENEEQIELEIESKTLEAPKEVVKKKNPKQIDEDYVPPEIRSQKL